MPIEVDLKERVAFLTADVDSIDPDSPNWNLKHIEANRANPFLYTIKLDPSEWKLRRIEVDPQNPHFCSIDGVLYTKDVKTLVRVPCRRQKEVTVPPGVETVGPSACKNCIFTSIVLPDSVTTIEDKAFFMCPSLQSVNLGAGVETIGKQAFNECFRLKSVVFSKALKKIGAGAFDYCHGLGRISIPEGVVSIESRAFDNCLLDSVTFPDSLRTIGPYAFRYNRFKSLELPKNLTKIGKNAFEFCPKLESVSLPRGIKSIAEGAFGNCASLEKIDLPDGAGFYRMRDGVLFGDGGKTLLWRAPLHPVRQYAVPAGVTKIGAFAFGHSFVETVSLPDGLETIEKDAFSCCYEMTEISVPNTVKAIGHRAFESCFRLKEIVIPDGIESIGYRAFDDCRILVIRGSKSSYAEEYAAKNEIEFKQL
ncbi:MAG: leucine-rich repeat domain-containing protein [Thermoguttaceae bacterium]|nr:leucine-rich repeat domain-containing protein [Thermoguttaceae bacterium]